MGPGSIFDLLQGELIDIMDYAVDHHKKTGRPPKLAVNATSWWSTNMTAATAQSIRDKSGVDCYPIERNILFYTLRILHLGIKLHLVFGGPKRLCNGGKLYPGHDPPSQLFRDTLTNIGIPWHGAPAEAEAECAKMEMEGVVDGVWSEDGDALAFGSRTLIKSFWKVVSSTERAEDRRKSFTDFRIYKLDDLTTQYPGMNREGFVLHAILKGRPDDVGELYNLGPEDVLDATRRGLAKSLYAASESAETLKQWAKFEFTVYLKRYADIDAPPGFPRWQLVQDYLHPVTSSPEVFSTFAQPQDPFLGEQKLFSFLVDKFQWTITQWVRYVLPVRIVRSLLATDEGAESQHDGLRLECDLKRQKIAKKPKATFLICKATSLDTSTLKEKTGKLETLLWILRKANFNQQRSIASFMTPDSDRKGKGVASGSISGNPFQRMALGSGSALPTPSSGPVSTSNGEGPSGTRPTDIERLRRQSTPPSPTPTSRKRKLPWKSSKNVRAPPKHRSRIPISTNDSGKGKEKEVLPPPMTNTKRARPSENSTSSSQEIISDKRPRLAVEQLPSTPPGQTTDSTVAVKDCIMIESDSDEDAYRSFPSSGDIPALVEEAAEKVMRDGAVIDLSSGDEFGSFPASPDLFAYDEVDLVSFS